MYIISWSILITMYFYYKEEDEKEDRRVLFVLYSFAVLAAPFILCFALYEKLKEWLKRDDKSRGEEYYEFGMSKTELELSEKLWKEYCDLSNPAPQSVVMECVRTGTLLHTVVENHEYNNVLDNLDRISLPNDMYLDILMCEHKGHEDISKPVIRDDSKVLSENIFTYLLVEPSCQGAWQSYLLYTLWHSLPVWWHAAYAVRDYIFSKEDFKKLRYFLYNESDRKELIKLIDYIDITPRIKRKENNFYISCVYWSEHRGLMREYTLVSFNETRVLEFRTFKTETIYKFNIGIIY